MQVKFYLGIFTRQISPERRQWSVPEKECSSELPEKSQQENNEDLFSIFYISLLWWSLSRTNQAIYKQLKHLPTLFLFSQGQNLLLQEIWYPQVVSRCLYNGMISHSIKNNNLGSVSRAQIEAGTWDLLRMETMVECSHGLEGTATLGSFVKDEKQQNV